MRLTLASLLALLGIALLAFSAPPEPLAAVGQFDAKSGSIAYSAPAGSVTTFVAR